MAGNRKRKFSQSPSDLDSSTDVSNSLISAVEKGDLKLARKLISSFGLSHSSEWSDGYILLHNAIKSNKHRKVIKLLLTSGSKVNLKVEYDTDTPLHFAVENDDMEIVKMLLDRSANIEAKTRNGKTPLHIAAQKGYSNIVEYLLKYGAKVNCVYRNQFSAYTPLHFAANKGCEKTVKVLLSRDADLNANFCLNKTSTPLYIAIISKNEQIVKILLEHAANVKPQNKYCNTILHFAIEHGCSSAIIEHILEYSPINHEYTNIITFLYTAIEKECLKVVEEIIKCGIDINMVHTIKHIDINMVHTIKHIDINRFNSMTPLHYATINQLETVVALLINYGANVNSSDVRLKLKPPILHAVANADLKMTKLLLTNGADIKGNPEILNTAVRQKSKEIIELLLQYGANISASDEFGRTPLHFTALKELLPYDDRLGSYFQQDNIDKGEIAKLLLSRGANVDAQNKKGETTLHIAVVTKYTKVVDALLEYNANLDLCYGDCTLLHRFADYGEVGIITMLLNKGADVNAKNKDGTTALHIAVKTHRKNIVELLLNYGATVCAKFIGNKTSIHLAAEENDVDIVELLLKYGADIDSIDKRGRTALHLACKRGNKETVVALLKSGGDVNILNKSKHTAIEYCWQHPNRTEFVENGEVLKEHFIKMKSANLYLHTNNLKIIEKNDSCDLRNACNKELESMKNEKIGNLSFHDVLAKNINEMSHYARNEDIIQTLKSDDYKTKFTIYASMINNHFKKAVVRMELLEQVRKLIKLPLPLICTDKIFSYLNTEDLRELLVLETRAVEPEIKTPHSDSDESSVWASPVYDDCNAWQSD